MANEVKQFTINGVTHDVMDVGARQLIADLQTAIDAITSGDTTTAIKTFQEVIDFLDGVSDDTTLIGKLNELRTLISAKVDKVTGKGLSTEDYTTAEKQKLAGLSNYDDTAIQNAIAAKYTKPSTGIPASDIASGVIPDISGKANSADVYTKDQTDALVADAGKVKSVSINNGTPEQPDAQGNVNIEVQGADGKSAYQSYLDTTSDNPKKTEAQWVASLKGKDGATGATGPQGNSGVASADGIESVNNLNGAPADTASKVYVLGANMGKELNNTFSPLKPLIGDIVEEVVYEKGRYTNYNVNIGSAYTGNAENGGTGDMRAKFTVKAGDIITVYGKTSSWGGLYAFCDTDDILVAKTAASQNVEEGNALVFTAPTDGTIYLNASNTADYGCTWQHKEIVKADVSNDGIMSKEQAAALTVATEETVRDKNLNKMKFGTIGTSTGTFAKYVDIPRSCFGNRGFLWFTDGDYTTVASWTGYVTDGVFTRHDFLVGRALYRLYSGDDQYYITEFSLEGIGDCDFIRLSLYQYDDAKIAAMFVGSDLDADYLSWDFVKLRKIPPVSSEWYRGESEEIAAIVTKNPSGVPGVYVSQKNLVNPYAFRFAEISTVSPCYPIIATDYIPVVPGTIYTKTIDGYVNNFSVWFYDSNKNRLNDGSTLYDRFVAPSDAAYARIFLSSYKNLTLLEQNVRIQLEQGERTEFEPYFLFPNELKKSQLSGKTFATIGDSFTAPATWVSVMCDILGASSYKNVAKSGGRWSYYADPKCAYLQAQELVTYYSTVQTGQTTPPAKPDYILCVLGVNDSNNNIPIGEIVYGDTIGEPGTTVSGEINPSTFTGGIQALLKTLKDNFPTSIIKIGYTPGGMQYHQPNQLELVEQYIDRLKLVANLYGVGYIETRACGMCRINQVEYEAYRKGQSDPHPNSAGQQRIGEYMARIMLSNL